MPRATGAAVISKRSVMGLAVTLALGTPLVTAPTPAEAGLLRPLLDLMQPNLEQHLVQACIKHIAGDRPALAQRLEQPCRSVAAPMSRCLIDETDRSGRGLAMLSELLQQRFGDDAELIVKRCLAKQLGLSADALESLPLQEFGERLRRQ